LRTYSLSDKPGLPYYRVTIKREQNGVASNFFHNQVNIGTHLQVKAPLGSFGLTEEQTAKEGAFVLLSAGVGLTPLVSMLNHLIDSSSALPIYFIHGARNGSLHAMKDLVKKDMKKHKVNFHFVYSSPDEEVDKIGVNYHSKGHITSEFVKQVVAQSEEEFLKNHFYLCGPESFMRSLYHGLINLSVPQSQIHYEFFGQTGDLTLSN